jgi:hypothetical protein
MMIDWAELGQVLMVLVLLFRLSIPLAILEEYLCQTNA